MNDGGYCRTAPATPGLLTKQATEADFPRSWSFDLNEHDITPEYTLIFIMSQMYTDLILCTDLSLCPLW